MDSTNYIRTYLDNSLNVDGVYSVHYFEYMRDFVYRGETHPFWEIVYADKKSLVLTADGEEIMLRSGQLFIHKPNEFHTLRCADGAANSVVFSFDCDSDELYKIAGRVITCGMEECRLLGAIISHAENLFENPLGDMHIPQLHKKKDAPFGLEQLLRMSIEQLLLSLLSGTRVRHSKRESTKLIEEVTEYLEQNITEKIRFEDIIKHFGTSASVIKRVFRDNLGYGVMEHFAKLKVEAAKQLIREGEGNFTQIADKLAFNTSQYFTTVFRRHTGMTPSEYERSVKAQIGVK